MMNQGEKLRETIYLERWLKYLSLKLKIPQIRFKSMKKTKREVREREISVAMREKMTQIWEIYLIQLWF